MKKSLILTVGAPGSGKSTWAIEQAAESRKGNRTIVLNRDDIRAMLFGGKYKYSRENEAIVTQSLMHTLKLALVDKVTDRIIIADTNLNETTRKSIYNFLIKEQEHYDGKITYEEKPFDVPWVELEKRNDVRGAKAVPKPVLRDMFLKMEKYLGRHKEYIPDTTKPKAVIFDIDGTLANNDHRSPFDLTSCGDDTPREAVVKLFKMYKAAGYTVLCVSGRHAGTKAEPTKYADITRDWLEKHDITPHALITRQVGDSRKDDIIKEEIFWNHIAPYFDVEVAVDDRSRVCEMWRRIGLDCFQVNFGEF